jgi:endonuclease VIII
MPEGDTIHRLAARLRRVLVGREVRAFTAHPIAEVVLRTVVGRTVAAVEARGKNLLVRLDDGRILHLHLRMLGRVRVEAPSRERAGAPPQLRLEVDGAVVTGRRLPVLRLLRADQASRAPELAQLGPDLLDSEFDPRVALERLRALQSLEIGEALLVQKALAGIGNVYKSEVLYLERTPPRARVRSLDDAHLARLIACAQTLMKRNLGAGARRTRQSLSGPRLWVYGRGGKPCLSCGTAIETLRQGAPPGRSTYHCPSCQAEATKAG